MLFFFIILIPPTSVCFSQENNAIKNNTIKSDSIKNDSLKAQPIDSLKTDSLKTVQNIDSLNNENLLFDIGEENTDLLKKNLENASALLSDEVSMTLGFKPFSQGQTGLDNHSIYNGNTFNSLNLYLNNSFYSPNFQLDYIPIFYSKNMKLLFGNSAVLNNINNKNVLIKKEFNVEDKAPKGSFMNFTFENLYRSSTIFDIYFQRNFSDKFTTNIAFRGVSGSGSFTNQKRNIQTLASDFNFPINDNSKFIVSNVYTSATKGESMGFIDTTKDLANPQDALNDTLTKNSAFENINVKYLWRGHKTTALELEYNFVYDNNYYTSNDKIVNSVLQTDSVATNYKNIFSGSYSSQIGASQLQIKSNLGQVNKNFYTDIGFLFGDKTTNPVGYSLLTKLNYNKRLSINLGGDINLKLAETLVFMLSAGKRLELNQEPEPVILDSNKIDTYIDARVQIKFSSFELLLNPFYNKSNYDSLVLENYGSGIALNYKNNFLEILSNNSLNKNNLTELEIYSKNVLKLKFSLFENSLQVGINTTLDMTSLQNKMLGVQTVAKLGNAIIHFGFENVLNSYYTTIKNYPYPARNIKFGISWSFID